MDRMRHTAGDGASGDSDRAKSLFLEALERPEQERSSYLDQACAEDAALRRRVAGLLEAHDRAQQVLGETSDHPGRWATPSVEATAVQSLGLGPGDRVGPYELEAELGAGGFGVVFRARQHEPVRRRVALKVVRPGMDSASILQRFELERQALALMDHPHIARVLDAGTTDSGRPFFAMELVEGPAITAHCRARKLGLRGRVELFARVARAVQHAHQRGVLHRDLKPSNVLVTEVDGEAQPKVIDFGIAKAMEAQLTEQSLVTHEGHLLGTPAYMSPEQLEGAADIDTRADVYSLGALLYELVAGAPPLDLKDRSLASLFQAIREEDPMPPSARRRALLAKDGDSTLGFEVPPELDWIVMRCLDKERELRYASALDLALDAERFLGDEPVEAAPPSRLYRVRKLVRRHRAATAGAVGVALALVLGTLGTSIGLVRSERANEKLDAALLEARDANEQLDLALVEERRQTDIAEAVRDFLIQDLLGAARPTGEERRGPETTIATLLDVASAELDQAARSSGRFAAQPLVEASLRYTLGVAYDTLGRFDDSQRHLERCLELRELYSGPADVREEVLVAASYLGMVLRRAGSYAESIELQTEALELSRELLGEGHRDTLQAASRLANALGEYDRHAEAIELMEASLPVALESLGARAPGVTDLQSSLAILYAEQGRYAEAEPLFLAALETQRELLGPESPVVLNGTMNLATLIRALGRPAEAEGMYRELLEVQRRVEGPDHPHTMSTLFNLAECMAHGGRLDEARSTLDEAMPTARRAYGPDHPRTILWMATRARWQAWAGLEDEAIELYGAAIELGEARMGAGHSLPTLWREELAALESGAGLPRPDGVDGAEGSD